MELKLERKERAGRDAELRKIKMEQKKEAQVVKKVCKEVEKVQRDANACTREAFM